MTGNPERLLAYILQLGLDYRYDPDRDVLIVRTEKHSRRDMYGRFYLAGGDELVELPRDVVFGDYERARDLIDTARGLADTFGS
jgi:hypothetical protein